MIAMLRAPGWAVKQVSHTKAGRTLLYPWEAHRQYPEACYEVSGDFRVADQNAVAWCLRAGVGSPWCHHGSPSPDEVHSLVWDDTGCARLWQG